VPQAEENWWFLLSGDLFPGASIVGAVRVAFISGLLTIIVKDFLTGDPSSRSPLYGLLPCFFRVGLRRPPLS